MFHVSADNDDYWGTVATPTFNPVGGTYSSAQIVTIQCATNGATIYYTIDGSEPSSWSTAYSGPIMVNVTTTIKARAFMWEYMMASETALATYEIKVASPTFDPAGGAYSSAQNIVLSCPTPGATITYTTDGSEPSSSSATYSSPIIVTSSSTIKAKAFISRMTDSDTASATYTINLPPSVVSTPTFNPASGTYSSTQNVTLSCNIAGATITYTTDGSDPVSSSTPYSTPIQISVTTTIKAKASMRGMTDSDTASATYTITTEQQPTKVTPPTFSVPGGTYSSTQSVTIECATSGAIIRYTTSGLYPDSYSPVYSGAIFVGVTTTIRAKAFVPGMENSDVVSATYTISASMSSQELLPGLEIGYAAIAVVAVVAVVGEVLFYLKKRKKLPA